MRFRSVQVWNEGVEEVELAKCRSAAFPARKVVPVPFAIRAGRWDSRPAAAPCCEDLRSRGGGARFPFDPVRHHQVWDQSSFG